MSRLIMWISMNETGRFSISSRNFKLVRNPGTDRNPTKETSVIFLTWVERELKEYCRGRTGGICRRGGGAAADSLSDAGIQGGRRLITGRRKAEIFFHQARNDGRNLDANLYLVKEDLRNFITSNRLDTLFLSLGGGAKILGFELSRELGDVLFRFWSDDEGADLQRL
jgi:hypothetical protein